NGLVLLAERMEHVRSAAMNFLVPAGCAYDPPGRLGVASILAEMITRGAGDRDSRELSLALHGFGVDRDESVGAVNRRVSGSTPRPNLPAASGNLRGFISAPPPARRRPRTRAGARDPGHPEPRRRAAAEGDGRTPPPLLSAAPEQGPPRQG